MTESTAEGGAGLSLAAKLRGQQPEWSGGGTDAQEDESPWRWLEHRPGGGGEGRLKEPVPAGFHAGICPSSTGQWEAPSSVPSSAHRASFRSLSGAVEAGTSLRRPVSLESQLCLGPFQEA